MVAQVTMGISLNSWVQITTYVKKNSWLKWGAYQRVGQSHEFFMTFNSIRANITSDLFESNAHK